MRPTLARSPPAAPPARPARAPDEDGLPTPRRHLAAAAVLAAIVLAVLDGAIANVALPTIAGALQVSPAASVWVVTGYQVALVMALLPCAALGESLGYRRVFAAGVALFTVASGLCALSPTLPWLVAARFLQGLGGAAIMSLDRRRCCASPTRSTARHGHRLERARRGAVLGRRADDRAPRSCRSRAGPGCSPSTFRWGPLVLLAARALPATPARGAGSTSLSVALNAGVVRPARRRRRPR